MVEKSNINNEVVNFTEEQILMLQLCDKDILMDRTISQEQFNKVDLKWLKENSLDGDSC